MTTRARPTARALGIAFAALLLLAGASFALSYAHLGRAGVAVAMVVAGAKGAIVLAVFMELAHEPASVRAAFAAAGALIATLIGLVAADVITREPADALPPPIEAIGVGPSRAITEGSAKTSAGNGEGIFRP